MHNFIGNSTNKSNNIPVNFKGENKVYEAQKLSQLLNIPVKYTNQTHGTNIAILTSQDQDLSNIKADAIITTLPNVAIGVYTADCIPLLIECKDLIGAVHLGRKSLVNGLAQKVLKTISTDFGVNLANLKCYIGPSLGFENHTTWVEEVTNISDKYKYNYPKGVHFFNNIVMMSHYLQKHNLTFESVADRSSVKLDAVSYLCDILTEHGVDPKYIFRDKTDTFINHNFHSYRRDYPYHGLNFSYIFMGEATKL